jgi:hypothetical protein
VADGGTEGANLPQKCRTSFHAVQAVRMFGVMDLMGDWNNGILE